MCGIAGTINNTDPKVIKNLLKALLHRGPDEQNSFTEKNVSFVHTRLSIQDIQHGQQPLHHENYSIVFNGQIYNHLTLRQQYLQSFPFKTQSDTETLLALYIQFGPNLFQYLDGMYAFAILDRKKHILFLARDRAGKKPFYSYQNNQIFAFSSKLNALRDALPVSINHDAIASTLRCGLTFREYTPYHEVTELLAGHYLTVNLETLKTETHCYFNLLDFYLKPERPFLSFTEALECVDDTLQQAVTIRLESSELEVGAFLSGGIDSSLIVAMAAAKKNKLKTFTIKFKDAYDESQLARLTAERYATDHQEIQIDMHVADDLEKILLNYGEPFIDSSAIPSYYVAKEAKRNVTVTLNGDGADELFGGYRRYVPIANGWMQIAAKFSWLTKILPKPHHKQSHYTYIYRLLTMASKKGLDFQISSVQDLFTDYYTFPNNVIDQAADTYIQKVQKLKGLSELNKKLYLDFSINLFSDLLVKMDIATMACSLEGRSPFLAKDMMILATCLPDQYKIKGTSTKYILRELAKTYLPDALINQPKRGFEVPLKSWLNNELKPKLHAYLEGRPKVSDYISHDFIQALLHKKLNVSDEKRAKMLWALLATEIWLQNH